MAAPVLRPLAIGEVLDTGFGLYRSLFAPLLVVAIACRALPIVFGLYLQQTAGTNPFAIFDHWKLMLVTWVLALVLNVIAVAATTFMVSGAYLGHPVAPGTALRNALHLIVPLSLLSFFTGLVIGVGFLLLIVPGLILASGLMLATAVVVLEQPIGATAAMGRSWELTKGYRFKVFVAVFVTALLFVIPVMIVGVLSGIGSMTGVHSTLVMQVLSALLQIFIYPFIYIVITVLYYDLRVRKEGFDLDLLAAAAPPPA